MLPTNKPVPMPLLDNEGQPLQPRAQPGYYPGFSTMSQKGYWDEATRTLIEQRIDKNRSATSNTLKFFTTAEEAVLRAVCERILPQEDRLPERRIHILAGIDERLAANRIDGYRYADMPSDQEAYRIAARAFDEMAEALYGDSYAKLGILERETILQQVHDKRPQAAQATWQRLNLERFWTMLVSDCCSVYYAHPWAWDEIGFGGPAYPRGYMRLEDGEPEPWEVREQRYAWQPPADTLSGKPQKTREEEK